MAFFFYDMSTTHHIKSVLLRGFARKKVVVVTAFYFFAVMGFKVRPGLAATIARSRPPIAVLLGVVVDLVQNVVGG